MKRLINGLYMSKGFSQRDRTYEVFFFFSLKRQSFHICVQILLYIYNRIETTIIVYENEQFTDYYSSMIIAIMLIICLVVVSEMTKTNHA